MGKASTRAHNKYIAKAYDRINLTVPKGKKDTIQAHAEAQGESVNGFINRAIDNQISHDCDNGHSEARQGPLGDELLTPRSPQNGAEGRRGRRRGPAGVPG